MGWIRVEDDFYDNEKMLAAGSIGRDLYWHGMGFCNRNLTDGMIPKRRALTLVDFTDAAVLDGAGGIDGQACAPIAVQRLLEAELWHEDGHDCPSCPQPGPRNYIVHDYLKYQFSKAQIEEKAEKNRQRVSAWREARKAEVRDEYADGNALRTPRVQTTPTPTPTPNTLLVDLGGELTQVSPNDPPPICSKHGENNAETPCRACKRRREWQHTREQFEELVQLEERRRQRKIREQCPICDDNGLVETPFGMRRCDHQVAAHA